MTSPQQGPADRRPPPLGLRGLSRLAFQRTSPPPGGGPPLGLTGRALSSFSIGTAGFEPHPPPSSLPRRRVGLSRPSRPPAPNEAGLSNWSASVGGGGTSSGGTARSSFVGFNLSNGSGGISFGNGNSDSIGFNFSSGSGGIRIGGIGEGSFRAGTTDENGGGHGGHNGHEMTYGDNMHANTTGIGGNDSTGNIGYRGKDYNPNFAHADELKEKEIRRITSELKPLLTDANQRARVEYCLRHLERCSLSLNPTFRADMDVVHIEEKWFYRTRKTQNMYLCHREEAPHRECKHKNHIQNIMFLSAMAIPRYDAQGNCVFDGKIGVWAYTEWVQAKKKSPNRPKGTCELKPADKVVRNKSREYLVKYVLPAIKLKWPESDRWNTIYVQQDNGKSHIMPDDPLFVQEAARGGWDIRMTYQPPNSPDTNILDLGWFASIQAMFHRKMPKTLREIVQKVN